MRNVGDVRFELRVRRCGWDLLLPHSISYTHTHTFSHLHQTLPTTQWAGAALRRSGQGVSCDLPDCCVDTDTLECVSMCVCVCFDWSSSVFVPLVFITLSWSECVNDSVNSFTYVCDVHPLFTSRSMFYSCAAQAFAKRMNIRLKALVSYSWAAIFWTLWKSFELLPCFNTNTNPN